jgi:hypothetical protein
MSKSIMFCLTALIAVLFIGSRCNTTQMICQDGDMQDCFCPDGTQKVQACMADGSGWELCACGTGEASSDEGAEWCDQTTDLCWQNPPYQKGRGLCWQAANDYCQQLIFDGHDDWWLPDITELRTLVVDCPQLETDGACPVEDGSGWGDMDIEHCTSCGDGAATMECYWDSELQGTCNRSTAQDPAVEYWSSSPNVDDPTNWAAFLHFGSGTMGYNHTVSWGDVRCVRNKSPNGTPVCAPNDTEQCTCEDAATGAKKCSSDGSSWGDCVCIAAGEGFENECDTAPTVDPEDCNTITVTITAPAGFSGNPFSLTGFIYTSERCCPPNGPPDGGWDVYENPGLTVDTPFVMDIHGINIAQTACLPPGEYYVLITVMLREDDPLRQQDWRGFSDEPLTLGSGDVDGGIIELVLEE